MLTDELGAGPLAVARAQRAQTARLLLETTDVPVTEVAFAAGLREPAAVQRHDPGDLRDDADGAAPAQRRSREIAEPGTVNLRLTYRQPCDVAAALAFPAASGPFPGSRAFDGRQTFVRALDLPHGAGHGAAHRQGRPERGYVRASLRPDAICVT